MSDGESGRFVDERDNQSHENDRQVTEEFTTMCEGTTTLFVPKGSLLNKVPPRTPAFFNPAARLSRDISILVYTSFIRLNSCRFKEMPISLADAFSGVGARSIRVANEIPSIDKVILNDLNPVAIKAAEKSATVNYVGYKCSYSHKDVHSFLNGGDCNKKARYAILDLDPFGSPSPYMDSLLRAVTDGGLVSVTATDTAVLYGKFPNVCFRKYYSRPINCTYSNETAVRILISFIGLVAGRMDLAIEPIFAHSHRHYSRVYLRVYVSSNDANKLSNNLGYVTHCFNCGDRRAHPLTLHLPLSCGICGCNNENDYDSKNNSGSKKLTVAGPLWIMPIFNKPLISDVLCMHGTNNSRQYYSTSPGDLLPSSNTQKSITISGDHRPIISSSEGSLLLPPTQSEYPNDIVQVSSQKNFRHIIQLLNLASLELDDQPFYYTIDEVGSALKVSPPPMRRILEQLIQQGFRASRTSFRPTGFKTNASMEEIKRLL